MERKMGRTRRWTLGAMLAVGLALPAALPAQAGGTVHNTALVEAKDASRSTLTLAGQTYRVGSQTRLLGLNGQPITLRDLRAGADRDGVMSDATADTVEFERDSSSDVLDLVRVVDMMPR